VTGDRARDGNDRVIYDERTGKLFYDVDSKGGAGKVLFAKLTDHPDLSASDFLIV
jgi:Ca2+-binding RTX toxin-like protein